MDGGYIVQLMNAQIADYVIRPGYSMKTREQEISEIPMQRVDQSKWPRGVRTLANDETEGLGVDAAGTLYWLGKPVEIRRPLELSRGQSWLGTAAAISAVILALWDTLRFFGHGYK